MTNYLNSQLTRMTLLGSSTGVKILSLGRLTLSNSPNASVHVLQLARLTLSNSPGASVQTRQLTRLVLRSTADAGRLFKAVQLVRLVLMSSVSGTRDNPGFVSIIWGL